MDRRVGWATGHRKKERNSLSWPHYPLSSAYPSQGEPTQLEIVPLTGKGKAGYVISYFSLSGFCVRNPLCLCPTQRPAELSWATEMAGARKKSRNFPTNLGPVNNPSSHWPALQRMQRLLSLRKSTSLEQPLWNPYQFHVFSPPSLAGYWSLQMISAWVPSPCNTTPPPPPPLEGVQNLRWWPAQAFELGQKQGPLATWVLRASPSSGDPEWPITRGHRCVCIRSDTLLPQLWTLAARAPTSACEPGFGSVSSHWPALLGSSAALLAFPLGTYTLPVRNLSQQGLHYHLCPGGKTQLPQECPQAAMNPDSCHWWLWP